MNTVDRPKETRLEFFLPLDGLVLDQRHGFYAEILCSEDAQPGFFAQDINLSITLRDDVGSPIMKFWNRLSPLEKPPKGPIVMSIYGYDGDGGMNALGEMKSFSCVAELLDEFFAAVDRILPEGD